MFRIGSGYLSSDGVQITNVENIEIIPPSPETWSIDYSLYKFTFKNDHACTCTINGQYQIYLRSGQGFSINEKDLPIRSFIIHERGVAYNFIGAY